MLKEGLSYCIENENLIVKSIKVFEKEGEFEKVRKLFKNNQLKNLLMLYIDSTCTVCHLISLLNWPEWA